MTNKTLLSSLSLTLLISHSTVHAAGFAIIENSASGMGNAFAGAAAVAEDASTIWFNPAGMSRLGNRPSISSSAHIIIPTAKFIDRGSSINPTLTGGDTNAAIAVLSGQPNDTADKVAFVPNLYYVRPINERLHFGVGMNAPFGLELTYKDDWIGRYLATSTEMKTININPAISWQANDKVSLGFGVNAQYIEVELGSNIDSAAACLSAAIAANSTPLLNQCRSNLTLGNATTDSSALISGDDLSFGYNLGILVQSTERTRIGASYRSKIKHELEGDADFTVNDSLAQIIVSPTTGATLQQALQAPGARLEDRSVTADAELPDSFSLSVAHQLNPKIELLADATWTGWSSFKEIRVIDATGADVALTPEEWNNSWRYSIGGNYHYSDAVTLRAGVAFDESPIPSPELRTPRVPGNDRTWLSFGADYKLNENMNINLGYAHLFIDDAAINSTSVDNGYTLKGLYEADVDILSAQLNWKF